MKKKFTLNRKQFQYKEHPDGEIIVYTSDKYGNLQEKSAIVISPYTIQLIKNAIIDYKVIKMGASRDNPPPNSLGALLKKEKQSPQQLSYLIPILIESGVCEVRREGRAFIVIQKGINVVEFVE